MRNTKFKRKRHHRIHHHGPGFKLGAWTQCSSWYISHRRIWATHGLCTTEWWRLKHDFLSCVFQHYEKQIGNVQYVYYKRKKKQVPLLLN